jgi:hypothetical protein
MLPSVTGFERIVEAGAVHGHPTLMSAVPIPSQVLGDQAFSGAGWTPPGSLRYGGYRDDSKTSARPTTIANDNSPPMSAASEIAELHVWFDKLGVPREHNGEVLSLIGRVEEYAHVRENLALQWITRNERANHADR